MRVLMDTHALLWHRNGSDQLGSTAISLLADPSSQVAISVVSLWEIAVKRSLGKLTTAKSPAEMLAIYEESGVHLLPITIDHVTRVETLPWYHRDPFDRMLIAQAQVEGFTILTRDDAFKHYDVTLAW